MRVASRENSCAVNLNTRVRGNQRSVRYHRRTRFQLAVNAHCVFVARVINTNNLSLLLVDRWFYRIELSAPSLCEKKKKQLKDFGDFKRIVSFTDACVRADTLARIARTSTSPATHRRVKMAARVIRSTVWITSASVPRVSFQIVSPFFNRFASSSARQTFENPSANCPTFGKQARDLFNNCLRFYYRRRNLDELGRIPTKQNSFSNKNDPRGPFFRGPFSHEIEKIDSRARREESSWNAFARKNKGSLSRPPLFGLCTKMVPVFSTRPTFHVPLCLRPRLCTGPLRNLVPGSGKRTREEEKKRKKREKEKKRVRGAVIIRRCNRYDLSPGVVRHLRARRARWMVNVKPRVSLAWPSRRLDHNAWSCRSQADYNHGDPTFYRRGGPSFLFYATLPLVARAFSR